MVSIYKSERKRLDTDLYVVVEFRGLSSDTKPTTIQDNSGVEKKVDNGSVFIEIDTGDVYIFDLANEEWNEV